MTKINQIYKCSICGNIIEALHIGADSLVCCDKKMDLQKENSVDAATEKHLPVINIEGDRVKITVGEVPHPMTEEHFIEWIEIIVDGLVERRFLKPGDEPQVEFGILVANVQARAFCNLHGLWATKSK